MIVVRPNPVRREIPIQDEQHAPVIRKLHCRYQSGCLRLAAMEWWPGMSCEACEVEEPITRIEFVADLEGMVLMWQAVNEGSA